jgi:hypothetical protein
MSFSTLVKSYKGLLSKWFYNTSTGVATGAARWGSFVGGSFGLLVASYGWTRWIQRFMWFGPPERNTLRLRENWVVLLKPVWVWAFFLTPQKWCPPEPFIAQGRAVTMRPGARQVAPRWLKPYTVSRVLMTRSSKWCLARCPNRGVIMSYHSAALNMAHPVMLSCRVISPL